MIGLRWQVLGQPGNGVEYKEGPDAVVPGEREWWEFGDGEGDGEDDDVPC